MEIKRHRYLVFLAVFLFIISIYTLVVQGSDDNKVLSPSPGMDLPAESITLQNSMQVIPISTTVVATPSITGIPKMVATLDLTTPTLTIQSTKTPTTPKSQTIVTLPPQITPNASTPIITLPSEHSGSIQSSPSTLDVSDSYAPSEVIVRFKPQSMADPVNKGKIISAAHKAVSATVVDDLDKKGLSGMQVVRIAQGKNIGDIIAAYKNNSNVLYATPNYKISIFSTPNDPSYSQQWALPTINAPQAWDKTTGSNNVVIALLDTGIDYNHPDLSGNIWTNPKEIAGNGIDEDGNGYTDDTRGWNFIDNNNDPMDANGHGTECAGIIGAIGNNNLGTTGVDWNVRIMPLKVINDQGYGYESDAIDAILYANQMGANIISISWGGNDFDQALKDAIDASPSLVVCAAGNSGQNNDNSSVYPASYDDSNLISVAASDQNDNLASFSNYGPASVDVTAPGVDIYSTKPGSFYGSSSGTSMAVTFVSGVAGLIKAQHPNWIASQIKTDIISTVDQKSQLSGKVRSGGRVNAYSAVTGTVPVITPTTPIRVTVTPTPTPVLSGNGTLAPVNPSFILFQQSSIQNTYNDGTGKQVLLGFRPSPLNFSHMTGSRPAIMSMGNYPASYDLRNYNRVTPVRDQGSCGDCWAYGAFGSLESSLMPTESWDFYEGDLNANHGFDHMSCAGGNNEMSTAYLARWSGPLNEGTSTPLQKHVQEVIYLPPRSSAIDNDNFKSAIMNYGGISTSFYWNSGYMVGGGYFYPPGGSGNHMITIVGWDDTHAVSGAPGVGAFLCKNSWGSGWNGNGYFWISYYDGALGHEEQAVFHDAEPSSNYDTIYKYDPLGESIDYGYGSTTGWAANVFNASSNQTINAVSFYTTDVNTAYTVSVYTNPASGPTGGTFQTTTSGSIPYAGYHTVLISSVQVQNEQKFSVIVKLTNPRYTAPIALEYPLSGYSTGARASTGQSYVSSDGNSWSDITNQYANTNVCIKAFGTSSIAKQTYIDNPIISTTTLANEIPILAIANYIGEIGVESWTEAGSGTGVYALATGGNNNTGVYAEGDGANSYGIYSFTPNSSSDGVYAHTNGSGSHGVIAVTNGPTSYGLYGATSGSGSHGVIAVTSGSGSHGIVGQTYGPGAWGVYANSAQSIGLYASTGVANGYGIYTPNYIYAKGTKIPSSDVAEYMSVTENVTPGTVMVIGDDGKLQASTTEYDTTVAGIVSTSPGVILGTNNNGNLGGQIIAIAGRVPCKVDATKAPIHAGDLLTTSDKPGYAMKAIPDLINGHKYYPDGTILGKAGGTLESGTGTIEVIVALQ